MFNLGNFAVKELIYGVAEKLDGSDILYTLDQLTSAEIAVEAESQDITDKNGAVIRTIYKSKTASVNANSALISPALMNASSGSDSKNASATAPIDMPKIMVVQAGKEVDVADIATDSQILVKGIYANGANGVSLTQSTAADAEAGTFAYDSSAKKITVPAQVKDLAGETVGAPQYIIKYTRSAESGMMMKNSSNEFPKTIALTFYAAIMDPCEDTFKAAYIVIPSFTPDPAVTISMSSDSQEMAYNGKVNLSYCDPCGGKVLYYIFFPNEEVVTTVECDEDGGTTSI